MFFLKKESKYFFAAMTLSFVCSAYAGDFLHEAYDIALLGDMVSGYVKSGVKPEQIAVACDMDETLFTTHIHFDGITKPFPQSRFFDYLKKELAAQNDAAGIVATHDQKFNRANDLVTLLDTHGILTTNYTQATTKTVIDELAAQGVQLFILTARPSFAATRTNKTLAHVGISFKPSFLKTPHTVIDEAIGCICSNAVLYAQKGKIKKGDAMVRLFEIHNYQPRVLIAIDDRTEYLDGIDEALAAHNITYKGIWYRHAEQWSIDELLAARMLTACFGARWWDVTKPVVFEYSAH